MAELVLQSQVPQPHDYLCTDRDAGRTQRMYNDMMWPAQAPETGGLSNVTHSLPLSRSSTAS